MPTNDFSLSRVQAQIQAGAIGQPRTTSVQARFAAVLSSLLPRGIVGRQASAAPRIPAATGSAASSPEAFDPLFRAAAQREGMDEDLVKAVAEAESGFRADARSSAGAIGVMQLMPGTARALGVNPYDPAGNIAGGTKYLKTMLDRFGSVPLALAAYNAGPGAVEKYGGIPPYRETKTYVDRVMRLAQRNEQLSASTGKGDGDGGRPLA